ncbi:MAG: hypothetical protein ACU84Q_14395 [Gammaproteobacteria bacterium]
MNWDVAGVVAEIIGAATVVITLIYLTIEMRQNRIAVEAATQASISEGWNSVNAVILGSAEVGEIWAKGFTDPDSLNPSEKVRFMILGQSYINQFTLEKRLADSGALLPEQWEEHAAALSHIMSSEGGKYIVENVAISPDIRKTISEYRDAKANERFLEIPGAKAETR